MRTGLRFVWYSQVLAEGSDEAIALETGVVPVEFTVKCPYDSVEGTDTDGSMDGLVLSEVMRFTDPAQSSVHERVDLSFLGINQLTAGITLRFLWR